MNLNFRRTLHYPYLDTIRSVPPAKLIALLVVIVAPGGFLFPVCYAVYAAIRRSWPAHDAA
jgi:hypothetical protein